MTWREQLDDLLYNSIKNGTTADIEEIKQRARDEYNEQKGSQAELKVVESLSTIPIVQKVNLGNNADDKSLNDVLVVFVSESGHLPMAVQVKTSWDGVGKYKAQIRAGHEDNRRMFMKVHPDMSNTSIIKIFLANVRKIDGYI